MPNLGGLAQLLGSKLEALSAKGLAAKPWFHGTRHDVIPSDRPLWLAEDPMVAALYTGGGRRTPVSKSRQGGRLYPFVTKDKVHDTGLSVTADMPKDRDIWLEKLGIRNPESFRRELGAKAEELARKDLERYNQELAKAGWTTSDNIPLWDDLGYVGSGNPKYTRPGLQHARQFEILDRPAFREQLLQELGPEALLQFTHPASGLSYSKRGVPQILDTSTDATVLFAPSPKDSVRSIFDFKRGGLARMRKGH